MNNPSFLNGCIDNFAVRCRRLRGRTACHSAIQKTASVADLRRQRAVDEAAHAAIEAARQAALHVVERWNAERSTALWSPTLRCAITAGTPWLDIHCPR